MNKAAIVVGVHKTGGLVPLNSAVAEAERVAAWLKGEGFKVKKLTDERSPVTADAIAKAVEAFVTVPPQFHLLVVYFSGHGYWQARSDQWLLSGAPTRTHEAINLRAAMDLARYSGIPNVVFVSDACRSIPNARAGAYVDGIAAFPNLEDIVNESKVDSIKATSEARPAYEATIDGAPRSVLTAALMSAYEDPEPNMVLKVVDNGRQIEVVPNRQLEGYLQRKVDALMAVVDPNGSQTVAINVPSAENVFIARVRRRRSAARSPAPVAPPQDSVRHTAVAVRSALSTRDFAGSLPPDADTEASVRRRLPDARHDHLESRMGFFLRGAVVAAAVSSRARPDLVAEMLESGDGADQPALVRVRLAAGMEVPDGSAISVAVRFTDGRCVVLAALAGYIGHAFVKAGGLTNVSYVPSTNHWRFGMYQQSKDEIDRLRALVALAVDRDVFQLRSESEAQALAERIRVGKAVDPSLGLYAAQAFAQAGNDGQVHNVLEYMRDDIHADLYDVRLLLSRRFRGSSDQQWAVVPFCPLLTQNWSLLAGRGMQLPPVLAEARRGLLDALWTTFDATAGAAVFDAVERGEL